MAAGGAPRWHAAAAARHGTAAAGPLAPAAALRTPCHLLAAGLRTVALRNRTPAAAVRGDRTAAAAPAARTLARSAAALAVVRSARGPAGRAARTAAAAGVLRTAVDCRWRCRGGTGRAEAVGAAGGLEERGRRLGLGPWARCTGGASSSRGRRWWRDRWGSGTRFVRGGAGVGWGEKGRDVSMRARRDVHCGCGRKDALAYHMPCNCSSMQQRQACAGFSSRPVQ